MEYTSKLLVDFLKKLIVFDKDSRSVIEVASRVVRDRDAGEKDEWGRVRSSAEQQAKNYSSKVQSIVTDFQRQMDNVLSYDIRDKSNTFTRLQKCKEALALVSSAEKSITHKDVYEANKGNGLQFCSKCGQTIAHQDNQNSASSTYWSAVEKEVARDDKIRIDAENKIIAKQKKKNRTAIVSLITLAIIAIAIFYVVSIYPKQQFNTADRLLENGEYHEAMAIYEKLGNYKNASEQIAKCQEGITEQQYLSGVSEFQKGKFETKR